jgi:hypothetical protein
MWTKLSGMLYLINRYARMHHRSFLKCLQLDWKVACDGYKHEIRSQ